MEHAGRGKKPRRSVSSPAVALAPLMMMLSLLSGCREGSASPTAPAAVPLAMHFTDGDAFVYSTWGLDGFENLIPSSHARSIMRVISTQDTAFGMSNVVAMTDSTLADSVTQWAVDTVRFSLAPNGDVYQYGLIAAVVRRVEGRHVVPRWDRIAAFSLGFGATWVVGSDDSLDGVQFSGVIDELQDYFSVDVNGRQTIVPAYHVNITGGDYERHVWITDSPSSFTRIVELATATSSGMLQDLVTIEAASR